MMIINEEKMKKNWYDVNNDVNHYSGIESRLKRFIRLTGGCESCGIEWRRDNDPNKYKEENEFV